MNWYDYILLQIGLSWALVGLYRWYARSRGILDAPNERSSHKVPTPRGAGIVFVLGMGLLLGMLVYKKIIPALIAMNFIPVFFVGLLGYADDRIGLSSVFRFVIHLICAAIFLLLIHEGGDLLIGWINLPLPLCFLLLVIGIVWSINLYNFMDGTDGIATVEAMFCLTVGGFILFSAQGYALATYAFGMVAILTGFLIWNWPVAKVFMGDSGSGFLGFMIAAFALLSYKMHQIPIEIWGILTAMFWFDATVTLLRRMLAKEQWYKPHRKHAYQRMVQSGWSHQQVLLSSIVINTILSALAYWAYRHPKYCPVAFASALLLLSCVYLLVEIAKPMYKTWHTGVKPLD